uniref:Uncharacterized protein n=1 Tax=Staphylococcus aureus TaxID=1280 RepID=A0A0C6ES27_STAAU|nr:hypothetical protein [Staphylococcus aureus]
MSTFSLVFCDFCFAKRTISVVFLTCLFIDNYPVKLPMICSKRSLTRLLVSICLCHCLSFAMVNNSSVRSNCSSCCGKNCLLVQK